MSKQAQQSWLLGSNLVMSSILWLGSAMFVYEISKDFRWQWDLSEGQQHQLNPEFLKTLEQIDAQGTAIEIIAFTNQEGRKNSEKKNQIMADFLDQIAKFSKNVQVRMVDFDEDLNTAQQLGVTEYGQVVLKQGQERVDIKERQLFFQTQNLQESSLEFYGEDEVLRALNILLNDVVFKAYVTTGHGELSLFDNSGKGLSEFRHLLELQSIQVKTLNLLSQSAIPEDAALVIVPGASVAFSDAETMLLLDYIAQGGTLWMASDVHQSIFSKLQVTLLDGIVCESNARFPYWDHPIVSLGNHAISQEIQAANLSVVLASSRAFELHGSMQQGITQQSVIPLSRQGWLENGGDFIQGRPSFQPEVDFRGEASMMAVLDISANSSLLASGISKSRVMLMGDADWLSNSLLSELAGNVILTNNSIHWLLRQDDRIQGIHQFAKSTKELIITKPQLDAIRWWALFPLPLVALFSGLMVWWNRRGR